MIIGEDYDKMNYAIEEWAGLIGVKKRIRDRNGVTYILNCRSIVIQNQNTKTFFILKNANLEDLSNLERESGVKLI